MVSVARHMAQAAGWPQLCSQLRLAKGLRQLVLDLQGRAAGAVPAKLASISCLVQLDSLQLDGVGNHAEGKHLSAGLRPLTRLTRLSLRFVLDDAPDNADEDSGDEEGSRTVLPWAAAVCRLTNLQELRVTADLDPDGDWGAMFRGALPAALSRLTALRHFTVLGMDTQQVHGENSDEPLLPALPALETAALQVHTFSNEYPGLGRMQHVVLSRIVSLSLALHDAESDGLDDGMWLPVIVAPALTELTLAGMLLAPACSELSWLPGLPKLRRLVLTQLETRSQELPQGVTACSGLTELVLDEVCVKAGDD